MIYRDTLITNILRVWYFTSYIYLYLYKGLFGNLYHYDIYTLGPLWQMLVSARFRFRTENGRLAKNQRKKLKKFEKIPIIKKNDTNTTQKKWDEKKSFIYKKYKTDTDQIHIKYR